MINTEEKLLFEISTPGARGVDLPESDVPQVELDPSLASFVETGLPEIGQLELVRHYTHLSHRTFSIDANFYPLGSCTMKYNPKVNEWAARLAGFASLHPLAPPHLSQGALELMVALQGILAEIAGMEGVNLQPAAGAQGELTGLMMIRAHHRASGRAPKKVLIPDSAHGTNPASCSLNGFETVPVPAHSGLVDPRDLLNAIDQAGGEI